MQIAPLIVVLGLAATVAGCGDDPDPMASAPSSPAVTAAAPAEPAATPKPAAAGDLVLRGSLERINGKADSLSRYKGDVVLVVNTASACGLTPQFGELEELYRSRRDRGFVILGVPSNDFSQEPLANKANGEFCKKNFGVSFPMFAKQKVTGEDAIPLFKGMAGLGEPNWNFTKYLIDRDGKPVARFAPSTSPDDDVLVGQVDALLKQT